MLIDSHSHRKNSGTQIIVNVHTVAVHPWNLKNPFDKKSFDSEWETLKIKSKDSYAVGECGLDRAHENIAEIEDQKYVLIKHFELANEKNLPIILHIVRAFSDLLQILKENKFRNPIMLHDYGGNTHEMQELLKYPVYP